MSFLDYVLANKSQILAILMGVLFGISEVLALVNGAGSSGVGIIQGIMQFLQKLGAPAMPVSPPVDVAAPPSVAAKSNSSESH